MEASKAQQELQSLLLSNEVNKEIKEKQRLEEQALDRKYARQYAEKLDEDEQVDFTTLSQFPPTSVCRF